MSLAEEYFNEKVQEEVNKIRVSSEYKINLMDIVRLLFDRTNDAKELYEDFSEQHLNVNAIEAEGAYRALETLKNELIAYYIPSEILEEIKNGR